MADETFKPTLRMAAAHSYFARHEVDKTTGTHAWGSDRDPSAGFIAWLLWGGEAGRDWAAHKAKRLA